MDGSVADKVANGLRIRPVTMEYALRVFPSIILKLRQGSIQIDNSNCPDTEQLVTLYSSDSSHYMILLYSDFELCRRIAIEYGGRLFAFESESDQLKRIKAGISVLFSGR